MKNNLVKQTVLKAVGKVIEIETMAAIGNDLPNCAGFLHQPKRPQKKEQEQNT
jgi:cyclic lactone autoinducer peptide